MGRVGGGGVERRKRRERVGRREKEGQDQQPPGLAAHRSCHSWEGRMGGWRVEGGVEREEVIQ